MSDLLQGPAFARLRLAARQRRVGAAVRLLQGPAFARLRLAARQRRVGAAGLRVGLVVALLVGAPLAGADSEPEGWGYEVANELMSPYCPGRTIADCPSSQADTLRMWILVQEAAGRTRDAVEAELLERFGDQILPAPRAQGFGLTAYAVPVAAFVFGGAFVALFLRRLTRKGAAPADPVSPAPLDPELERRVDEELRG